MTEEIITNELFRPYIKTILNDISKNEYRIKECEAQIEHDKSVIEIQKQQLLDNQKKLEHVRAYDES